MTSRKSQKRRAFEKSALAHLEMLYRFGLFLTGNAANADVLVQETYLKAYRFWDEVDHEIDTRTWLLRILRNSFINTYMRAPHQLEMLVLDDHLEEDVSGPEGLVEEYQIR